VYQNTFCVLQGLLDELEDLAGYNIAVVEDDLLVIINPIVGQVDHSDWIPMVWNLARTTIDHTGDFVRDDKL
jgi:hypothetical protein